MLRGNEAGHFYIHTVTTNHNILVCSENCFFVLRFFLCSLCFSFSKEILSHTYAFLRAVHLHAYDSLESRTERCEVGNLHHQSGARIHFQQCRAHVLIDGDIHSEVADIRDLLNA